MTNTIFQRQGRHTMSNDIMSDEEASNFNYIDSLHTAAIQQYDRELFNQNIKKNGRKLWIFMLDKKKTETSSVYGDSYHGRIYLPSFCMRAIYQSQTWGASLNTNIYEENDASPTEFTLSFSDMVKNIRELKSKVAGKASVKNNNSETLRIIIHDGNLEIRGEKTLIIEEKLSEFTNLKLLFADIKSKTTSNIDFGYTGDSESAENMEACDFILPSGHMRYIEVKDRTYANCSDVVELGAVVMDDKFKCYTVNNAKPVSG